MSTSAVAEEPRLHRRRPFFIGWWMLGFSAAAFFLSAPGQSYSVAAFKNPMQTSLGISETNYSLAYAFATILSGLSLPFVGRALDRFGARRTLPVLGALLACGCLVMSRVDSLPMLYVGFSSVRCLGQGALTLVASWLIGEWFHRRRGMATAVAGLGSSVSLIVFPSLNHWLITEYDWPTAWCVLAAMVGGVLVVPVALFLRDRPEDLGLHPDGEPQPDEGDPEAVGVTSAVLMPTRESWTVEEVMRDSTFWKLMAVPATNGLVGTGLIFHQRDVLGARGVSEEWAYGLIGVQATIAAIATLPAGWLTDRLESRYLLGAAMVFLTGAVAVVLTMTTPALALLYATLMGLQGSILRSTGNVVWINYYGRRNQGAVRGVAFSVMVFAAAVGPLPLAFASDHLGSTTPALLFFLAMPVLAGLLVSTARRPVRP